MDSFIEFENCSVIRSTVKSVLVDIDGEEIWVPKSQISDDSEVYDSKSTSGTLVIKEWFARVKGLI